MSSSVVAVVSSLLSLLDEDAEPSSYSIISTDLLFLPSVRSTRLAPSPCTAVVMESFSFLSGSCSFLLWMVKTDCSSSNLNRFLGEGGRSFSLLVLDLIQKRRPYTMMPRRSRRLIFFLGHQVLSGLLKPYPTCIE